MEHILDMWLQAWLLLVVLDEKRKVFGPVVLEVPRQVLVHVVLGHRDVEVGVQVTRVLWRERTGRSKVGKCCHFVFQGSFKPIMAIVS